VTIADAPAYCQAPIIPAKWARNGEYPDAQLQAQLVRHVNAGALVRLKEHAALASPLPAPTPTSSVGSRWRCTFRTSPFSQYLWVRFAFRLGSASLSFGKGVRATVTKTDGTFVGTCTIQVGGLGTATPATWQTGDAPLVDAAGDLVVLEPGVVHHAHFEDLVDSSLVFATVYEWSVENDIANGLAPGSAADGTPILDADRQSVAELASLLWNGQASHLWNWTTNTAAARTTTSGSTANLIDTAVTTVSASSPGATLDLSGWGRVMHATTTVHVWVYGRLASPSGTIEGRVTLRDSTGAVVSTVSGFTTAQGQWRAATAVLPASKSKYDLHFELEGTGSGTFHVWAVSIFPCNDTPTFSLPAAALTLTRNGSASPSRQPDIAFNLSYNLNVGGVDQTNVYVYWKLPTSGLTHNAVDLETEVQAENPGWTVTHSVIGPDRVVQLFRAAASVATYTIVMPFAPLYDGAGYYAVGGPYNMVIDAASTEVATVADGSFALTIETVVI
jgi:hypothetical protein